jgi:PAS domain S-box-containing protein
MPPTGGTLRLTERIRRHSVRLGVATVLAVTLALIWFDTWQRTRQAEDQAVAATLAMVGREANQAASELEARLQRLGVLHSFARAVSRAVIDHDPRLPEKMADMQRDLDIAGPEFVQAGGIGPDGLLTWANLGAPRQPLDLSDREHFRAIAVDGKDQIIGTPVRGKVSNHWTIQTAEAMRKPNGDLEQVTVISVETSILHTVTRYFENANASVIALYRSDGTVLAREPEDRIGQKVQLANATLRRATERPGQVITRYGVSTMDGTTRFYGTRAVANTDMVVSVGIDESVALAQVRESNRRAALIAGEFSLLCCLLAFTVAYGHERRREMRQREAMLLKSRQEEALLHRIANRASDVIVLIDGTGHVIYHNVAFGALTGKPPMALDGTLFEDATVEQDKPIIHAALEALARDGGSRRFTTRIQDTQGVIRWMETELVLIPSVVSGPEESCRYMAIGRDVTSRMEAEARLRQTDQELRILARTAPGGFYRAIMGPDGLVYGAIGAGNPVVLAGYTKEEWGIPGFLSKIVDKQDLELIGRFREALLRDGCATAEYRVIHRDGRVCWHRNTCYLTREDGSPATVNGYIIDITAEKTQERQLDEARRMISLGEMTTGIGHELKQPLTVISMAAENAKLALTGRSRHPEMALRKLDQIIALVDRGRAIIDGMRKSRQTESESTAPQDLIAVVEEAGQLMQTRLEEDRVALHLDLPKRLPAVTGSKLLFEQVFINLITNACDAYKSDPSIEAERRRIDITGTMAGGWIVLTVADRAGGIPDAVLRRVFEPFFTTKGQGSGTGLGLSVCYGIINQAGGTMPVTNAGGGAQFEIRLPAVGNEQCQSRVRPISG